MLAVGLVQIQAPQLELQLPRCCLEMDCKFRMKMKNLELQYIKEWRHSGSAVPTSICNGQLYYTSISTSILELLRLFHSTLQKGCPQHQSSETHLQLRMHSWVVYIYLVTYHHCLLLLTAFLHSRFYASDMFLKSYCTLQYSHFWYYLFLLLTSS